MTAIDYFKEAVELDPDYSEAYTVLASVYGASILGGQEYYAMTGKEYFEAKILMRHYINLALKNPTPKTYQLLAGLENNRRNYDKAIMTANKAVKLAPNDADILKSVGLTLIFAGQPEKAISHLDKSRMLDPLNRSMRLKGGAYFVMGNYEAAANCFENSITNVPDIADMTPFIAATYAYLGQDAKAKNALEKWLSLYVDGYYPDIQTVYSQYAFKDKDVFNRFVKGLIKAGWQADPNAYYSMQKEYKLSGKEISDLVIGRTQTGTLFGSFVWENILDSVGQIELSNNMGFPPPEKGRFWIENDSFCIKYKNRWDGISYCSDIYKNPYGNKESNSEYLSRNDAFLMPFSVLE